MTGMDTAGSGMWLHSCMRGRGGLEQGWSHAAVPCRLVAGSLPPKQLIGCAKTALSISLAHSVAIYSRPLWLAICESAQPLPEQR